MPSRKQYWSCTKFADIIRGTDKIGAGTSTEWKNWKHEAKSKHPIRFWIAEEGLYHLQNFVWAIPDKIYDLKYYINNRWVTRTHSLTAHSRDIKPGTWCDVGRRFVPCLFNELVDFVEIEQAWMMIAWDDESRKKYKTPWWGVGWFRWRTWRCPEAGLDYLKWAAALTNEEFLEEGNKDKAEFTSQALAAQEIMKLYDWWKNIRPSRPDPYDASGWSEYCNSKREGSDDVFELFDRDNETPEQRAHVLSMLDKCHEIEKQYEDEDEEMLIRLIKIRQNLWT